MREDLELILLRVSQSPDIDEGVLSQASRLIIDSCCEGLRLTRAGIWLLDNDSSHIRCQLLIDKGNDLDRESLTLSRQEFPNYFAALDCERSITADDAYTHSATFEFAQLYLKPLGISSMLDVPIRHRGQMIGIICCEHQGPARQWQADEVVFASSMADLYGRAVSAKERADSEHQLLLANQNLEDKVKQRTAELEQALQTLQGAQEQLIDSEKMAALGSLVAGVAHEVNTPLGIALTSVSHCADELRSTFKSFQRDQLSEQGFTEFVRSCQEGLQMAEDNLLRAGQLIHDFKRTAADQSSLEREEIELASYVLQIINPLRSLLRKQQIELVTALSTEIKLTTFPGIIAQLLTNLISNCQRHAFVFNKSNRANRLTIGCGQSAKGVYLYVEDNGVGIKPQLHKKIFEPFYTTARDKGGTGLGLPILYNLVTQKLNGEIELDSAPEQGTRFTIWLSL